MARLVLVVALVAVFTLSVVVVGCSEKQTAKTTKAVDSAGKAAGDAVETAVKAAGGAVETAVKATGKAVESAGKAIDKATDAP
jgi:type II secretory pathway pseudopilin PulG